MNQTATKYNVRKCNHSQIYSIFSRRSNKPRLVIKETKPATQTNEASSYLGQVEEFCNDLLARKYLPKRLAIKDAVSIVLMADRFEVSRFDALRYWKISKKGVVISASFLQSLFRSRGLLVSNTVIIIKDDSCKATITTSKDKISCKAGLEHYIDNTFWNADSEKAFKEQALMMALRKAFPDLLIGVVCRAEVSPSSFSKLKVLGLAFYNRLVSFSSNCFIAFITAINFISSIIVKKTNNKLTATNTSKNNSLNKYEDFLDFDDLQVKSNYETKHLN